MAPTTIPEGHVFVARAPGVAAALLEAADSIKADRKMGIRTVAGGYHVYDDIAEAYQAALPEVDEGEELEDPTDEAEAAAKAAAEKAAEERGYPDGEPHAEWTVKNLEAWAKAQDPVVDLGDGNKPDKLAAAVKSIKSAE